MRKSSSAALFSLTPAPMLPLLLLHLIVVVLCLGVAVVDALSAPKVPWSSNSIAAQVLLQPSIARPLPGKFHSVSFLQKFYLLHQNDLRSTACLSGIWRQPLDLNSPQQPSPNVNLTPHFLANDPTLQRVKPAPLRSPSSSLPDARNHPSLPSSTHRPLLPHWLLPPSSPPHALGVTKNVTNVMAVRARHLLPSAKACSPQKYYTSPFLFSTTEIPSLLPHVLSLNTTSQALTTTSTVPLRYIIATVDLCHFPSVPRPRLSNICCPPRVNLAPSCFDPDFPQSDSIKVVSICSSDTYSSGRSSIPVDATLVFLHCNPSATQQGREGFAPPASFPPKVNVSNTFQSDFVGKDSRRTQNGWSMTENIVKLNHTFQYHSLSYFWYPAFKATSALLSYRLHSETTASEKWSRLHGKTLANPRDSFYLKITSQDVPLFGSSGQMCPTPWRFPFKSTRSTCLQQPTRIPSLL